MNETALVLCGNPEQTHVGCHLYQAALTKAVSTHMCDSTESALGSLLPRKFNWWFRGHRPVKLGTFSEHVLATCRALRPRWLLTTGVAPVTAEALVDLGRMEIVRVNYATDDPWNPAHRAQWFLEGLSSYDHIFSPRRANLDDFRKAGCAHVHYLPFAYNPEIHFWEPDSGGDTYKADIAFVGGADRDRLPWITALIRAGLDVALYGGYWDRYPETRAHARGFVTPEELRRIATQSKISLCLVRQANRDGHCMRTFEIPASGGCMLAEDSEDHRSFFGDEGRAVWYFAGIQELVDKARALLKNDPERERLRRAARQVALSGNHTYADRFGAMLHSVQIQAHAI